jgi:hypothetical protein
MILLEHSFLDYKMHNTVKGMHMYLQHLFCISIHTYSHLHAVDACARLGSAYVSLMSTLYLKYH